MPINLDNYRVMSMSVDKAGFGDIVWASYIPLVSTHIIGPPEFHIYINFTKYLNFDNIIDAISNDIYLSIGKASNPNISIELNNTFVDNETIFGDSNNTNIKLIYPILKSIKNKILYDSDAFRFIESIEYIH